LLFVQFDQEADLFHRIYLITFFFNIVAIQIVFDARRPVIELVLFDCPT